MSRDAQIEIEIEIEIDIEKVCGKITQLVGNQAVLFSAVTQSNVIVYKKMTQLGCQQAVLFRNNTARYQTSCVILPHTFSISIPISI